MAKIVAFYSYKGGVGRSLSLANAAISLSQRGRRVVCVDFDLEAGGLHTIFGSTPKGIRFTLLDVLAPVGAVPVERAIVDLSSAVNNLGTGGGLWLLPSIPEISKIDRVMADQRELSVVLSRVIEQIEEILRPHVILVDSRSGFAELAATSIRVAQNLVCVMRPNRQNADGIRLLLRILATRGGTPKPFLALSQVPRAEPPLLNQSTIEQRIEELQRELGDFKFGAKIPFVPSLALDEIVEMNRDPGSPVAAAYRPIADWIDQEAQ